MTAKNGGGGRRARGDIVAERKPKLDRQLYEA